MYRMMQLKDQLLNDLVKEAQERGTERLDGDRIDMVKDLAEAIYYCKVAEAMDGKSGYGGGTGSSAGYGSYSGYGQQGNMNQGYSGMSGHTDVMSELREKLQRSNPDERERLRSEVLSMIGAI